MPEKKPSETIFTEKELKRMLTEIETEYKINVKKLKKWRRKEIQYLQRMLEKIKARELEGR